MTTLLSTPSLGITFGLGDPREGQGSIDFQLPLSGSRVGVFSFSIFSISSAVLSTPSLGITEVRGSFLVARKDLSTPSLGITYRWQQEEIYILDDTFNSLSRDHVGVLDVDRDDLGPSFQLPLSGSPSTCCSGKCRLSKTSFQLPLSGSLERGRLNVARRPARTFNSLSRDHLRLGTTSFPLGPADFQLPLSGSLLSERDHDDPRRDELSTPSLGITKHRGLALSLHDRRGFQLPLSGSLFNPLITLFVNLNTFNSLSRDHVSCASTPSKTANLTFNSLSRDHAIRRHAYARVESDALFQLPLSGSHRS